MTTNAQEARAARRYPGCYVCATGSGDLPTLRWRVTQTFTPPGIHGLVVTRDARKD